MADATIGFDESATIDKRLDAESLTVAAVLVHRERMQVAGTADTDILDIATDGAAAKVRGLQVLGTDGTNAQILSTNTTGHLNVADGGNVLSVDDAAGSLTIDNATLAVVGGGVEATALRVTLASDSTGVVSVDDNGGSLTVDGTVAVSGTVTVDSELTTADVDTGVGTDTRAVVGLVGTASGGGQLIPGSSTDGLLVNLGANNDVTASQTGTWTVQPGNTANTTPWLASIHDGTTKATVRDLASNDALNVAIVDGSGAQITSFGGGTEYTEDAVAAADPVGKATILVRKDTPAATVSTDGDNIAQRGTNFGAAYCQIVTSSGAFVDAFGGSGGTAQADESAFTEGTTNMTPIGGVLNDTIVSDPTEDQAAAVRINAKRALHVQLRDATADRGVSVNASNQLAVSVDNNPVLGAGTNNIGDVDVLTLPALPAGTNNIGDVDVLSVVPGTGATNLGKAIDTAAGATDTGIAALAVRDDALTTLTPIDGDFVPLRTGSTGALWVDVNTLPNVAQATAANLNAQVVGAVAHDAADSGNPIKLGAKAETALSGITLVADGDRTDLHAGVDGVLITRPHCNLEDQVQETKSNTDGASTAMTVGLAAPGVGIRIWLTSLIIANASATNLTVDIRDGSAGAVLATFPVPANGGVVHSFAVPLKFTANTAVAFDGSAAATTLYVTGIGFKSKV